MEEIKDLIKIITDHTRRNLPLLDLKNQLPNGNKEMNLFLGIKNGEFNTDEEASKGIYGSEKVDFKFRMLKSRLNRKLLNHLFFMEFPADSLSKSAHLYQEALDYLHFSRMLLQIDEVKLGCKLLYKTLDFAKECEFTGIVVDCLRELRQVYAMTYRPKLFQNIKNQINEFDKLERVEEEAEAIFQENRLMINSSVNNRKKDYGSIGKAIARLKKLHEKTNSYNIYERYFKLQIWYYELNGKYEEVLAFVDKLKAEYENEQINQQRFDLLFVNKAKGHAFIKLRKHEAGSILLEEMLSEVDASSRAWYAFAEQFVTVNIQSGQFGKASEVLIRVISNKSFERLEEDEILKWNIFRAYLYYLTGNKKIIKKFDYKSFVENTPEFIKDRAGYHVAILILQIMNLLNGDVGKLHKKLDAMDDYLARYLNNSFSRRTKTFGKLLHKIEDHNRDINMINLKSKYLRDRLSETEVAARSFVDFELVPYELLWEKAMDELKKIKEMA